MSLNIITVTLNMGKTYNQKYGHFLLSLVSFLLSMFLNYLFRFVSRKS